MDRLPNRFDLVPVIVLVALAAAGLLAWHFFPLLQGAIANQDCIATGRTNCL